MALLAGYSSRVALAVPWGRMYEMPYYTSRNRKPGLLATSNFMCAPAIGLLTSTIPTHVITAFYCTSCSFATILPRRCARTEQVSPCVPSMICPHHANVCLKLHGHARQ